MFILVLRGVENGLKKLIQNGKQKLFCKSCSKYQQKEYKNKACDRGVNSQVINYVLEGMGIRSISRVLAISPKYGFNKIKFDFKLEYFNFLRNGGNSNSEIEGGANPKSDGQKIVK